MRRALGVPHVAFGRFQLRQGRRHGARREARGATVATVALAPRGSVRAGEQLATGKHHGHGHPTLVIPCVYIYTYIYIYVYIYIQYSLNK